LIVLGPRLRGEGMGARGRHGGRGEKCWVGAGGSVDESEEAWESGEGVEIPNKALGGYSNTIIEELLNLYDVIIWRIWLAGGGVWEAFWQLWLQAFAA